MAEDMDETLRALVSGRVQGVGFRYFVLQHARRLGLKGTVKNLPDSRVEVLARGPRESLQELIGKLREGPRLSRIEEVKTEWGAPVDERADFEIRL